MVRGVGNMIQNKREKLKTRRKPRLRHGNKPEHSSPCRIATVPPHLPSSLGRKGHGRRLQPPQHPQRRRRVPHQASRPVPSAPHEHFDGLHQCRVAGEEDSIGHEGSGEDGGSHVTSRNGKRKLGNVTSIHVSNPPQVRGLSSAFRRTGCKSRQR